MAQKLEVLKPRNGASSVAPPRVLSDASMSLSFKLPASYVRPAPRASVVLQSHPTTTAQRHQQQQPSVAIKGRHPRDAWSDDDNEGDNDNALSWEDRDFSVRVDGVTPPTVSKDDKEEQEHVSSSIAAMEIGGWEEQDAPDLPDDFPLLLVNLTRMQKEHFPQEKGTAGAAVALTEEEMQQVFELVKETLHRHFTQMVEVFFEQKSCFHCTYGTSRGMLSNLHAAYPDDVFGLIDYPTEIQGIELSEFLHVLSRPSRWKSVDYLKDCLRRCSRDLKWKLDVAVELEVLADKEYEVYTTEQERLGTEIDELTRLRDSFKAKLDKLAAKEGGDKKAANQQYLLLRKLEDIETRLVSLLDTYLQEPELEESECDGMFDGAGVGGDGLARGMNVLDMVVAMIFSRLPRDFSQQMTSEEHFQMLFDHHIHIRRLWKKDFGRLPPRTNAAALYAADSDAESADEEEMKNGREDEQLQAYHHESDVDEEEFESYENVEVSPAAAAPGRGFPNGASSSSESWESVYADEPRGNADGDEDEGEGVKSDGYGADYESDESDDEHPQAATTAVTSSSTLTRRARSRRPTPLVFSDEEQETSSTARKKEKKVKSSKKEKKERKKKTKKKEDAPFQPFACTGALNFLRIAKENEMF